MNVTFEANVTVSQEDVDCIMVSALEGGITYWCDSAKVVGSYLGEYASDQISRGGCLQLHDSEENAWYLLTPEKFEHGLKRYLKDNFSAVVDFDKNGELVLDSANIDGFGADCIIQYAIFGELVYG